MCSLHSRYCTDYTDYFLYNIREKNKNETQTDRRAQDENGNGDVRGETDRVVLRSVITYGTTTVPRKWGVLGRAASASPSPSPAPPIFFGDLKSSLWTRTFLYLAITTLAILIWLA